MDSKPTEPKTAMQTRRQARSPTCQRTPRSCGRISTRPEPGQTVHFGWSRRLSAALVTDVDRQVSPRPCPSRQLIARRPTCQPQDLVQAEVNHRPHHITGRDRHQIGDGDAVFVALHPGAVPAAVGMNEPFAQGRDDGHATARMAVGKQLRVREIEEAEILRRHDRLFHRAAAVVESGVGAPPVIRYGHRAIAVEGDSAPPPLLHSASSAA